jgi:general secretion pathway protein D
VEGTALLENPSVYNREITSKITVMNERTIVIGGLIRDDTVDIEQKVPLLGDIPLLGLLFRKTTKQRIRTNLMVFITPHNVTQDAAVKRITEKKRAEQEEFKKGEK